jgi:hypothetical protein
MDATIEAAVEPKKQGWSNLKYVLIGGGVAHVCLAVGITLAVLNPSGGQADAAAIEGSSSVSNGEGCDESNPDIQSDQCE